MSQVPDGGRGRRGTAAALGLGTQLAAGMAFFSALGYFVDRRRGGGSAFTLAGIFLGLLYGGYEVWKVVRELGESDGGEKRRQPPGGP